MQIKRHMSRSIYYVSADDTMKFFRLSMAELLIDDSNKIISVSIYPFTKETADVEYHDLPLKITELADSTFSFVEMT